MYAAAYRALLAHTVSFPSLQETAPRVVNLLPTAFASPARFCRQNFSLLSCQVGRYQLQRCQTYLCKRRTPTVSDIASCCSCLALKHNSTLLVRARTSLALHPCKALPCSLRYQTNRPHHTMCCACLPKVYVHVTSLSSDVLVAYSKI